MQRLQRFNRTLFELSNQHLSGESEIYPIASVLIPTYNRAETIRYVLEGLKKQTFKDFEVLIVLKPSGDETQKVIEKSKNSLSIITIIQNQGCMIDALNIGLENAHGKFLTFLDDDAVPLQDWLEKIVETYESLKVGGVAGEVMPAWILDGKPAPLQESGSEIRPDYTQFMKNWRRKLWSKPLEGLEDYFIYISKAGSVERNVDLSNYGMVKSLLGMGANMSVLTKALGDFKFPSSWILGLAYEQYMAWHLWKKGYSLVFNPKAKVHHLVHGQTLSRQIRDRRKNILRYVEKQLLFYRLYTLEKHLSIKHRICFNTFSLLSCLKNMSVDLRNLDALSAIFLGDIIGLKYLISRKINGNYDLLHDLKTIIG